MSRQRTQDRYWDHHLENMVVALLLALLIAWCTPQSQTPPAQPTPTAVASPTSASGPMLSVSGSVE